MAKGTGVSPSLSIGSQNYNGIDLVKFFCALMVFVIHIPPFTAAMGGELPVVQSYINFGLQHYLCRLAVPFYFVCAGFFLFRKMPGNEVDTEKVKNYCFKLFRLIGMWSVLLFVGGQIHLWYLGATVVAVTLLSVLLHYRVSLKWLLAIAGILYIVGLLGDSYFGLIGSIVNWGILRHVYTVWKFFIKETRNGFFMGYIFVLIGYLFAQGKIRMKKVVSGIAFAVSMIVLFAEVFLLKYNDIPRDYNMYICLVPAVLFLFAFTSSLVLKDRPIYKKLRAAGVLVYFLHLFINNVVAFGTDLLHGAFGIDIQPWRFFISLPVTLIVVFGIEWLSRKEKCKWINWFLA